MLMRVEAVMKESSVELLKELQASAVATEQHRSAQLAQTSQLIGLLGKLVDKL